MDEPLTAAVEDFRRRIAEQDREVERLQGVVLELEAQGGDDRRGAASRRRAQADLARARDEVAELRRIYARFRLREGAGRDPEVIGDALFDEELLAFCGGPRPRRGLRDPGQGRIAFQTLRRMLLAGLPLADLLEQDRARRGRRRSLDPLDEEAGRLAKTLREWAAMTEPDPYVAAALDRASAALERYTAALQAFRGGLDSVRINYEIKQGAADRLAFRFDGDQAVVRAENQWAAMAEAFPEEATRLVDHFRSLRDAHEELRQVRDELNDELRHFMASFVALYTAYAARQSRPRRRRLGLGRRALRRLATRLLEEVESTDFLLAGGGGLEVPLPAVPRELAAFARTHAVRRPAEKAEAAEGGEDRARVG